MGKLEIPDKLKSLKTSVRKEEEKENRLARDKAEIKELEDALKREELAEKLKAVAAQARKRAAENQRALDELEKLTRDFHEGVRRVLFSGPELVYRMMVGAVKGGWILTDRTGRSAALTSTARVSLKRQGMTLKGS